MADVLVVNPLGAALRHYSRALVDNLAAAGAEASVRAFAEPSASSGGRARWILTYYATLMRARRARRCVLVLWPPLGFVDLVTTRLLAGPNSWVVVHDPEPLVRSVGYGWLAVRLASLLPTAHVISHSGAADDHLIRVLHRASTHIAHPVARPARREMRTGPARIRVLGQYKRDRDLALLSDLAARLPSDAQLDIVGRGWPVVHGWRTTDRFVDEVEFDALVRSSDAVLIPYRRFFQSGVAVRCVEWGTPVVGPAESSLLALLGADYPGLVGDATSVEGWVRATVDVLGRSRSELDAVARDAHLRAVADWSRWVGRSRAGTPL
ncbi:glycosyltransferase [Rhodococcus kroppenstedtii]|uniref:glycosyltransferase n=1 Tax=Rhodococcoides kroppenstedtii TaxID=293050 RepID=UPI001C9B85A5|nr:hypothetical protein [Rhodococcus kroppenstedtii]MBY6437547.1 glycosyltransferase [Rhodococcus kroppenstedtii]